MSEQETRPRGRPRKADTDERVLAAARALEAELGYDGTSVDAIAERAGVAKTSIYRRWPNKGLLMYEAVLGQNPRFAEIADTGDIVEDLLAVLTTNAVGFRDRRLRELISNLLADAIRDEALAARLREQFFGPRADAIAARVRVGVERGELAPTIDAGIVPALLTGPLQYLMIVRGSDLHDDDLRRVVLGVVGAHLPD